MNDEAFKKIVASKQKRYEKRTRAYLREMLLICKEKRKGCLSQLEDIEATIQALENLRRDQAALAAPVRFSVYEYLRTAVDPGTAS